MKTTKGTIELKMHRMNVIVECTWIGPIAIHKQHIGTTEFKYYSISNTDGVRILALDGWLFRNIVPMVEECLQKMEYEKLSLTVNSGEERLRLHKIFTTTSQKHRKKKS